MTEPRDMHTERDTAAETADKEPAVRPEVIADLDVTADDDNLIVGGCVGGAGLEMSRAL